MSKSLEELKNEFLNQASNNVDKCPECGFYSLSKLEDAWDAAIKAVSEREKKFIKRTEAAISFLDGINDKTIAEIEVYNSLSEALKECRGDEMNTREIADKILK